MKKSVMAIVVCFVLTAVLALGPTVDAHAECTTQGAYALALAQVLNFNVTTVDAAVSALTGIGVAPDGGWKPEECLTDAVIVQVRAALDRAVAGGVLPAGIGKGAADKALEALKTTERLYPAVVSPATR